MINRAATSNAFEFVKVAALRAQQLQRGCIPRVPGNHKKTTIAQMEIVAGKVARIPAGAVSEVVVEGLQFCRKAAAESDRVRQRREVEIADAERGHAAAGGDRFGAADVLQAIQHQQRAFVPAEVLQRARDLRLSQSETRRRA